MRLGYGERELPISLVGVGLGKHRKTTLVALGRSKTRRKPVAQYLSRAFQMHDPVVLQRPGFYRRTLIQPIFGTGSRSLDPQPSPETESHLGAVDERHSSTAPLMTPHVRSP